MQINLITHKGTAIAVIESDSELFTDAGATMNLLVNARYEAGADCIVIPQTAFSPDFFKLRTGLAGEILQKCVQYHIKLAIVGDYTRFESESLQAFIRESNRGRDFFFVQTEAEALDRLAGA